MKDLYLPVAEPTQQRRGAAAALGGPAARSGQGCSRARLWLQPTGEPRSSQCPALTGGGL
jgi:hypothetical protein